MDSKEIFKKALKQYLDGRAESDALFAQVYAKEGKTIDDCANFVIGAIKKKMNDGFYVATDDEVFGLAVHYYCEDDLEVSEENAQIVSNYQLTDAEKIELEQQAKENARASFLRDMEMKKKNEMQRKQEAAKKKAAEQPQQPSLFGDLFDQ